jgi:transposase
VTVVIDHERGEVVWAHEGKSAETLKAFFEELGAERCAELEAVTIDMSGAYIKAVSEATPEAMVVFDRFHVQRLAHDALDEVRRAEVREASDEPSRKGLKKSRWALQKNPWNLHQSERQKLAEIQVLNKRLYRAYLLKESLLGILDRRQVNVARRKLEDWLSWASRSRLQPFVKLARTVRKHMEGILNYIRTGLSNGRSEGMNGKVRTITRRSFGLHGASSLIGHIFLCCSGIELAPVHHYPASRSLAP